LGVPGRRARGGGARLPGAASPRPEQPRLVPRRDAHPPAHPVEALRGLMARDRLVVHPVGVRPNYVKASALLRAARALPRARNVLVDTGQHYDTALRDALYEDLSLDPPEFHLAVGSASHARQTAAVMVAFEDVLLGARPDAVVVYGDVNSTVACALV